MQAQRRRASEVVESDGPAAKRSPVVVRAVSKSPRAGTSKVTTWRDCVITHRIAAQRRVHVRGMEGFRCLSIICRNSPTRAKMVARTTFNHNFKVRLSFPTPIA